MWNFYFGDAGASLEAHAEATRHGGLARRGEVRRSSFSLLTCSGVPLAGHRQRARVRGLPRERARLPPTGTSRREIHWLADVLGLLFLVRRSF